MIIFSDAATSPQKCIAVGAFLLLEPSVLNEFISYSQDELFKKISERVVYQQYASKKSTWAEIKTVIDALQFLEKQAGTSSSVEVYTDCQSLFDLLNRRKNKLEQNNFVTRSGKLLAHTELYKEFFVMANKFNIQIIKIKGHASSSHRVTLPEKIFAMLDKLSRKRLRDTVD